jgi:hypothetical protein
MKQWVGVVTLAENSLDRRDAIDDQRSLFPT